MSRPNKEQELIINLVTIETDGGPLNKWICEDLRNQFMTKYTIEKVQIGLHFKQK